MIFGLYEVLADDGGEFELSLREFAQRSPRGAYRLLEKLTEFRKDRDRHGEFLRGSGRVSVFVVPPRTVIDIDCEAGVLALVDDTEGTVDIVRLLHPDPLRDWEDIEQWAERLLGI